MSDRTKQAMDVIRKRHSSRKFEDRAVSQEDLRELVDAGRLAASARNVQPWHFVVVTDKEMCKTLGNTTDHGKFIADAPACIVVLCEDTKYYLEDGCAATQNILVAGEALGLGTCWVAGDKKPYADDIVKIVGAPAGMKLICMIAVGYSADDSPRAGKKAVDEVLHREKF